MIVEYRTPDHPEANGRKPVAGEHGYKLIFPLENGDTLHVYCGEAGKTNLANVVLAMLTDAESGSVAGA